MASILPDLGAVLDALVDDALRERVERMRLRTNDFGYDRWGASPRDTTRALVVVRWFYRHYFRVETEGLEHLPAGRCMLIANHSAQLAYDGMLINAALALDAEPPRHSHAMVERFFAGVPFVNVMMHRLGQLIGIPANAERLLREDEACVLVFPEGARGGGKLFRERYQLQGFGQGFLRLALRTRSPIVPVGFIGGEEMVPSFSRLGPLARLLGAPYVPLTPLLLPLPLPTKVRILFGEPLHFDADGDADDDEVNGLVAQVEGAVAGLIERGLRARRGVFAG